MTGDPYALLGVPRDADADQIKRAYEQQLTRATRNGAFKHAQEIDAAYSLLRDTRRRDLYDRQGISTEVQRDHPLERFAPPRAVPFRAWSPAEPRHLRRRSRRRVGSALLAVLLVATGLGGAAWRLGVPGAGGSGGVVTDVWTRSVQVPGSPGSSSPPTHMTAHPKRLLPAITAPAGAGTHAYLSVDHGAPLRFDPCRPIRYVISGNEPFPGANGMLMSAISQTSSNTGLQFTFAGTSAETPTDSRPVYQPTRYGKTWAPVLIAWTDPSVVSGLGGDVAGLGGGAAAAVHGDVRLVSGLVYFDAPAFARLALDPRGREVTTEIMLHELGHLVGLGHVADKSQVMRPHGGRVPMTHYSVGDRQGLAVLGARSCTHFG